VLKRLGTSDDVSIQKAGTAKKDSKGNVTGADYTITVSTTNGTDGAVQVMDTLSWANNVDYTNSQNDVANQYYDHSSFYVVKKRSSGDNGQVVSTSDYTVEWTSTNGKPRFTVSGLPALAAGERYEVHYSTNFTAQDANKDSSIDNAATAYTPNHQADDSKQIDWKTDDAKSGQYDSGHQTIHWTVTLNQNGKNTDGLSMTDNLPGDLVGDITVKDANGNTVMTLTSDNGYYVSNPTGTASYSKDSNRQLSLNFGSGSNNGKYTVEYQTKAPAGTTTETVSNTAKTHYPDGTSHEATGTTDVTHQLSWDIGKSTQANTANRKSTEYQGKNVYRQAWSTSVTMPESAVPSFTVHDKIGGLTAQDGTEISSSYHYAIAKDLYEELCQYGITLTQRNDSATRLFSNYQDATPIAFMDDTYAATDAITAEVTMYDADGKAVDKDSEAHVKSFDVKIVPKDGGTIAGSNLTIIYSTTIDMTGSDVPEGTILKAQNTASIPGKSSTASTDVRKNAEFQKQILQKTTSDNRNVWSNATKSVEYDKADHSKNTATFRILIDTTGVTGDIEVTDKLPEGMSLSGSARLKYITTNQYSDDEDWSGLLSVSQTGQTITFKVKSGYRTPAQMAIQYDASFASDSDWDDESTNEKSYTNTATWNNKTSSSTVDVKRTPERVMKTGAQVLDENGQPTGTVKYHVVLNPKAEDLNPTSDYLDLTDVLTADASLQPDLDIQDVKLYAYSATAADHIDRNKELPDTIFSAAYDSASHTLKAKIPDSTACVLVYEYELKGFSSMAADKSVSNSVSLNGEWSKTASTSIKSRKAGGSATKGQFFLYKVDADNYKNLLSGAKFDLCTGESGSFSKVKDYTLDKGFREWDLLDTSSDHAIFKHDKLYKFVETKAPDDYVISDEPIYVMWLDKNETEEYAWNAIASSGILSQATKADGSQIQKSDVNFIPYGGGSIYVPNTYSKLTVKKAWTASDGTALADAPADSVNVKLYQDVTQDVGWTVTARCSAYGTNYQASQLVKKGSAITIACAQADWNGQANAEISPDGGASWKPMRYDTTDKEWKYTISSVTSDMTDIQLRVQSGYEWVINGDPRFLDFEKPEKQVTSTLRGTVTLKKSDGWTYSWSGLPATDGKGHEYTYHVEEENVPSGFKAIYLGNGITTGTITITNQKMVQLPETGGTGTGLTVAAGAALAAFAAAGLILLRKTGAKRRR
jgi:LPXTG-motif cell wall-anchored protein